MKKKNTIKILMLISLYLILLTGALGLLSSQKNLNIEDEGVLFKIQNVKDPEQILWHNDSFLVKKDLKIHTLNFEERTLEEYMDVEDNQVLCILQGELVFVRYENHTITNIDENATDIEIMNFEKEMIFQKSFHETIKPMYIENNFLFLIDNYLHSPERTYRLNLDDGEMEMFEIKERIQITGDEKIEILDENSQNIFTIPKNNDIVFAEVNTEMDKVGFVDTQGNIWIYLKNPNN